MMNRDLATRSAGYLGWFSIALGVTELVCARGLARTFGMRGREGLIRLYGIREIASGIGIFAARDQKTWLWGRVAGDGVDIATLLACFEDSPRKGALMAALASVAGVTVADVMTAQALSKPAQQAVARDYSDRSGLPLGVSASWGLAARNRRPEGASQPESGRGSMH